MTSVTVMGGGNGAHTMAADLSLQGYKVHLCEHPKFARNIEHVINTKEIEVSGKLEGTAEIRDVSTDFSQAVAQSEVIFVAVPSYAQVIFAERILPYLKSKQTLAFTPGNFGSLEIGRLYKEKGLQENILLGETCTLPYGCRLLGPGRVRVFTLTGRLEGLWTAAFPSTRTEELTEKLKRIYPATEACRSVLDSGLRNTNFPVHPTGTILNSGRVELAGVERETYRLYGQGISPSVAKVIDAVDREIISVGKALGYNIPRLSDILTKHGYSKAGSTYQTLHDPKYTVLASSPGPTGLQHRYVTEDVPFGLVPVSDIGRVLNVQTPIVDALVLLASTLNERDYRSEGRTLKRLGLPEKKMDIEKYLEIGQ